MSEIYLDYAATTPADPRVVQKMNECLLYSDNFGNPASTHTFGAKAKVAVEYARAQIARLINADPHEIIFTSGATEANNLALKGAAKLYSARGKHIITVKTEHLSVLDTCQYLEKKGFFVTYLAPKPNGLLDLNDFKAAIRPDTILTSVMQVNNEIGIIQDIKNIAELTANHGILFHVDAAQAVGKIAIDLKTTPVDLMSISAHKFYGPKGIGALYMRHKPRVRVAPQFHGGGHESGMRAGTLATHQIVGMGEAANIAEEVMRTEISRITKLRDLLLNNLSAHYQVIINSDLAYTYPGILNLRFPPHKAQDILKKLPNIALSVGSACLSKGIEPSYVLRALGLSATDSHQGIRFSFGRYTTEENINEVSRLFLDILNK